MLQIFSTSVVGPKNVHFKNFTQMIVYNYDWDQLPRWWPGRHVAK